MTNRGRRWRWWRASGPQPLPLPSEGHPPPATTVEPPDPRAQRNSDRQLAQHERELLVGELLDVSMARWAQWLADRRPPGSGYPVLPDDMATRILGAYEALRRGFVQTIAPTDDVGGGDDTSAVAHYSTYLEAVALMSDRTLRWLVTQLRGGDDLLEP